MKASTEEYVRLQNMYKERSSEEKRLLKAILEEQGGEKGVDEVYLDTFVRNAHRLKLIKGRKWGSLEDNREALGTMRVFNPAADTPADSLIKANALASSPKEAATHLGLSALESVFSKEGYSHLHNNQQQPQINTGKLDVEAQIFLPPGTSLPDPEWNDVAGELYV
jgi:amyloid beta precursor protein binding protein 1